MKEAEIPPILPDAQRRLLKATLAVYAAEAAVEQALDELVRVHVRYLAAARSIWLHAEDKLDEAIEKRKAVVARIRRSDLEGRGMRWLRLVEKSKAA